MSDVLVVIPARYGSTRLPGKPLITIAGKPVVQHVWERCSALGAQVDVVVATDDERIFDAVEAFGGKAVMTSAQATCGTDRLAEIAQAEGFAHRVYLNVQGDEPLIRSDDIARLVALMDNPQVQVGTLYHRLDAQEASAPTSVKVVTGRQGQCLYFSRSVIPFDRQPLPADQQGTPFKKHVGLYAFSRQALQHWPQLEHGVLEQREMLEQLRLLEAGLSMWGAEIEPTGPGVDTPETLEQVRRIMEGPAQPEEACEVKPQDPFAQVDLLVLDIDGVLTDGTLSYPAEGELFKSFNVRDGLGISLLQAAGIPVGIVTGRADASSQQRLKALGIAPGLIEQGRHDKGVALKGLAQRAGVALERVAYMGDDIIDLSAIAVAGLSAAPADAHPQILQRANWVSEHRGGRGAVRELAEKILNARGQGAALRDPAAFEALLAQRKAVQ